MEEKKFPVGIKPETVIWIFDIVMENVEAEAWEIILMSFKRLLLVRNSYLGWDIRGRDGPFYGDLLFDGIWRREKA